MKHSTQEKSRDERSLINEQPNKPLFSRFLMQHNFLFLEKRHRRYWPAKSVCSVVSRSTRGTEEKKAD